MYSKSNVRYSGIKALIQPCARMKKKNMVNSACTLHPPVIIIYYENQMLMIDTKHSFRKHSCYSDFILSAFGTHGLVNSNYRVIF